MEVLGFGALGEARPEKYPTGSFGGTRIGSRIFFFLIYDI